MARVHVRRKRPAHCSVLDQRPKYQLVWRVGEAEPIDLLGGVVELKEITSVRLKVEQNQLVSDGCGVNLGAIGLQGA